MLATIPFQGFYDSIHDDLLDNVLEGVFPDTQGWCYHTLEDHARDQVDWREVHIAYAKLYTEEFLEEMEIDAKFESLRSPKEYNFTTDRIFIEIELAEVEWLLTETSVVTLMDQAREMFTSRSGFISFYSPDINNWGHPAGWDHNQVGCLIEAYARQRKESGATLKDEIDYLERADGNGDIENLLFKHSNPRFTRLANIAAARRRREEETGRPCPRPSF